MNTSSESNKLTKGGGNESSRLEAQHKMWNYAVGGLYPIEIKDVVDQYVASAKNPVILDVGCGTAVWSIEIAERFPSAQVIGVDITPASERPLPSNFSYKKHNLTTGIPPEFKASGLDIIHCRMLLHLLPDAQALVDSLIECLKPGGFLFIAEGAMGGVYNEHKNLIKPFIYDPSLSIEENLKNPEGLSWHSGFLLALGLIIHPPTYQPPAELVKRSKISNGMMVKECWVPIFWEGDNLKHGKELTQAGTENVKGLYRIAPNSFLRSDLPPKIANALVERGLQEASKNKTYLYGWYVVARKPIA